LTHPASLLRSLFSAYLRTRSVDDEVIPPSRSRPTARAVTSCLCSFCLVRRPFQSSSAVVVSVFAAVSSSVRRRGIATTKLTDHAFKLSPIISSILDRVESWYPRPSARLRRPRLLGSRGGGVLEILQCVRDGSISSCRYLMRYLRREVSVAQIAHIGFTADAIPRETSLSDRSMQAPKES